MLPYELHVTIEQCKIEQCDHIRSILPPGVKLLMIDTSTGVLEPMTSSVHYCDSVAEAIDHGGIIRNVLESNQYPVQRIKVETVPWHPLTKAKDPNNYFECHIATRESDLDKLKCINMQVGSLVGVKGHLSRNSISNKGGSARMVTIRSYDDTTESFTQLCNQYVELLHEFNIAADSPTVEFCVYDSNVTMDTAWLSLK